MAIASTPLLVGYGAADLGKSVYLQPSFSTPLMFVGGILFGYGMVLVLANGCGSRALVLLGHGNLRSFVVVIVLGIAAQMTLRGLIAPLRVLLLQASLTKRASLSLPAPDGPIYKVLRLCWPKEEALNGTWKPAPIVRAQ